MNKDKFYQWFTEHNIKSISPSIGLLLVEVMKEINSNLLTIKDDELRRDLEEYTNALDTVCRTATIHQKAVIDKLDAFCKRDDKKQSNSEEERKVPPADPSRWKTIENKNG